MTKAIVSVSNMLNNLQLLHREEWYDVTFGKGRLNIGSIVISCECQHVNKTFQVKHSRIKKLVEVFSLLEEQPATIAIDDDGCLYIKEAIM